MRAPQQLSVRMFALAALASGGLLFAGGCLTDTRPGGEGANGDGDEGDAGGGGEAVADGEDPGTGPIGGGGVGGGVTEPAPGGGPRPGDGPGPGEEPDKDPEDEPVKDPAAEPAQDELCDKMCELAFAACGPVGGICEDNCVDDEWSEETAYCLAEAAGCREAFGCVSEEGPLPGPEPGPGPGPGPGPAPTPDCVQTCEDVLGRCGDATGDACAARCDQPGAGFPAACVNGAQDVCDDVAACFGSDADVCAEVCPVAEAACPGLLEDCAQACAGLPGPATACMGEAESCDDVIGCVFNEISDCASTCGRIGDICDDDVGDCIERCEAGALDADERLCAQNARSCRQFDQCLEFVEGDCIGACNNVERVCPSADDTCNFDCGVWDDAVIQCVAGANSCGDYNTCIEDEEGRDGPAPPDLPGGDDADEVCLGVCGGLIPAGQCPEQNALCQRGCRAITADAWACVAGAQPDDAGSRCGAIQECIGEAAEAGAAHSRLCDNVCDQVRRTCQGPIALFCEDTCRAFRPADPSDAENIECMGDVMEDGLQGNECNQIAQCLDLGFLGGGGPGGGGGGGGGGGR